jgi:hemerythrin superfamily protein
LVAADPLVMDAAAGRGNQSAYTSFDARRPPPSIRLIARSNSFHLPVVRGLGAHDGPANWEIDMPTAKAPDAVALLKADHRKVEELFDKFEAAKTASQKKSLAAEICVELSVHATIEEEIFYPACTGQIEEDDMVGEAYVEHDGAKVLIAELAESEPDDEFYDAKMKVLSEDIKHHVKEEERRVDGLFAQAKEAGLDLDSLGERLMARREQLLAQFKANGLPPPTTRAFTGHKLKQGKPVEAAAS